MSEQEELFQEMLYALKTALLVLEAGVDPKDLSMGQKDAFALLEAVIAKAEGKK